MNKSNTITIEDYIVVKTVEEAESLVKNYKGKDLAGKYVIVAPNGIEEVSQEDLMKLPAVKSLVEETEKRVVTEIIYKITGLAEEMPDSSVGAYGNRLCGDLEIKYLSNKENK